MIATEDSLTRLTTVSSEQEAAIIVAALVEEGIDACYMGETTANFRVGVPGKVHVYVSAVEYERARRSLDTQQRFPDDELPYEEEAANTVWQYAWQTTVWLMLVLMLLTIG